MKRITANCFVYIFIFAFILAAHSSANAAQTGKVNVLAWLEGGNVLVECAVPSAHGAQPVNNALITVFDNVTHKQLLQGHTNAGGRYLFKVPGIVRSGHGLRIQVNAGQGNVSDWVMSASELYEAAALTAGFESANLAKKGITRQTTQDNARGNVPLAQAIEQPGTGDAALVQEVDGKASQAIVSENYPATPAHVREIVNQSLSEQLAPIHKRMEAMENRGSDIVEVIGGIGWIIGLIALWFYFRSRNQSKRS